MRFITFWLTDKSGKFFTSDSVHHRAKMTESDLKIIPGFVQFGANMTHFGPKSVHPIMNNVGCGSKDRYFGP